jgi:type IV secretion system protein TrbL
VLASLCLLGLGLFGPAIAAGLVSGAPQLGAGAAIGTAGLAVGGAMVGGGAALAGGRLLGAAGMGAIRSGASLVGRMPPVAPGGLGTAGSSARNSGTTQGIGSAGHRPGADTANAASPGTADKATSSDPKMSAAAGDVGEGAPPWAKRLHATQRARQLRQGVTQIIRETDRGGAGASPDISEREE